MESRARPPFISPLAYINLDELDFIYNEVVVDKCYGDIQEGDTVVDVGANVGIFSLMASAAGAGRVIAIEASPVICRVLSANVSQLDNVEVVNAAVSKDIRKAQLTYYPRATGWSTLNPDNAEVRENMKAFLKEEMQGEEKSSSSLLALARLVFGFIGTSSSFYHWLTDRAIDYLLEGECVEVVQCETLESICTRLGVRRIDKLKVDCERAEMGVLLGIRENMWKDIGCIVMEVHSSDGDKEDSALYSISQLLQSHGFTVHVSQAARLKETNLYLVEASAQPHR